MRAGNIEWPLPLQAALHACARILGPSPRAGGGHDCRLGGNTAKIHRCIASVFLFSCCEQLYHRVFR